MTIRTLPGAIRALRVERSLTIRSLATRITDAGHWVHEATLSRVERGEREASDGLVAAIAAALGVPYGRIARCACGCSCQQRTAA